MSRESLIPDSNADKFISAASVEPKIDLKSQNSSPPPLIPLLPLPLTSEVSETRVRGKPTGFSRTDRSLLPATNTSVGLHAFSSGIGEKRLMLTTAQENISSKKMKPDVEVEERDLADHGSEALLLKPADLALLSKSSLDDKNIAANFKKKEEDKYFSSFSKKDPPPLRVLTPSSTSRHEQGSKSWQVSPAVSREFKALPSTTTNNSASVPGPRLSGPAAPRSQFLLSEEHRNAGYHYGRLTTDSSNAQRAPPAPSSRFPVPNVPRQQKDTTLYPAPSTLLGNNNQNPNSNFDIHESSPLTLDHVITYLDKHGLNSSEPVDVTAYLRHSKSMMAASNTKQSKPHQGDEKNQKSQGASRPNMLPEMTRRMESEEEEEEEKIVELPPLLRRRPSFGPPLDPSLHRHAATHRPTLSGEQQFSLARKPHSQPASKYHFTTSPEETVEQKKRKEKKKEDDDEDVKIFEVGSPRNNPDDSPNNQSQTYPLLTAQTSQPLENKIVTNLQPSKSSVDMLLDAARAPEPRPPVEAPFSAPFVKPEPLQNNLTPFSLPLDRAPRKSSPAMAKVENNTSEMSSPSASTQPALDSSSPDVADKEALKKLDKLTRNRQAGDRFRQRQRAQLRMFVEQHEALLQKKSDLEAKTDRLEREARSLKDTLLRVMEEKAVRSADPRLRGQSYEDPHNKSNNNPLLDPFGPNPLAFHMPSQLASTSLHHLPMQPPFAPPQVHANPTLPPPLPQLFYPNIASMPHLLPTQALWNASSPYALLPGHQPLQLAVNVQLHSSTPAHVHDIEPDPTKSMPHTAIPMNRPPQLDPPATNPDIQGLVPQSQYAMAYLQATQNVARILSNFHQLNSINAPGCAGLDHFAQQASVPVGTTVAISTTRST